MTIVSAVLFSCATTLSVNVTRPAKLDLGGAKTISVLPFKPSDYYGIAGYSDGVVIVVTDFFRIFDRATPDERQSVTFLRTEIERGLIRSPYVQVIAADSVQSALRTGGKIPADVYLAGEVIAFEVHDDREIIRRKIDDDPPPPPPPPKDRRPEKERFITEERFTRNVRMEFRYNVVDSKTNRIISYDRAYIRASSPTFDRRGALPSAFSMIEGDLARIARTILQDLQPYVVRKSIRLMEDKSKLPEMKDAQKLAKDGFLRESGEKFLMVYNSTGLLAAGYNAALLMEATGRLSDAETLMKELYAACPDGKVLSALYDIQNEIRQSERLQSQIQ